MKMKVNKKLKKGIKIRILYVVLFIILGSMTLGYSTLSSTFYLKGKATIKKPEYKILITDISQNKIENGGYQNAKASYTGTEGSFSTGLPNTTSKVIYNVTISNIGQTSGVLDYIFVSQPNSQVKYKIGGINSGDILASGDKIVVTVEMEYWDNETSASSDVISTLINFEFKKYESSYSNACTLNWDGSSSSTPTARNVFGTSYYEISNANEFKWFVDQINSGNSSINGILSNNICLNSSNISLIGSSNPFNGILDGQNRSITGISYTRDEKFYKDKTVNTGLFANNSGLIKNLNVNANISDIHILSTAQASTGGGLEINSTTNLGGIVVNNSGKIQNSSFSGRIYLKATAHATCTFKQTHTLNFVGGIAVYNTGVITGSYNKADFSLNGHTSKATCDIYSRSAKIRSGGIVAKNNGYISDCYNAVTMNVFGEQETTTRSTYIYEGLIGGVVGVNENTVTNSYNAGVINHTIPEQGEGSTSGVVATNTGTLTNVYYLQGTSANTLGTQVSDSDLKNLNISICNYYSKDILSINNGYPVLKWQ